MRSKLAASLSVLVAMVSIASAATPSTKSAAPTRPSVGMTLAEVKKYFVPFNDDPTVETDTSIRFKVFIRDGQSARTDAPHWIVDMNKKTQKLTAVVSVER